MIRVTCSTMPEVIRADYVQTARAKGGRFHGVSPPDKLMWTPSMG